MILKEQEINVEQKEYLYECLKVKQAFIDRICGDLQDGDESVRRVSRAKFTSVFTPVFSRPASLRQYVRFRTKDIAAGAGTT